MISNTFLAKLATKLIEDQFKNFSNLTIVLPNKRAKVFLLKQLSTQISATTIAPNIVSIEELIQQIAQIQTIESIDVLFEFYALYCKITPANEQEKFENFANWATTLLQDFNEIDRYLLQPNKVLKYLEDIKEIEHWSVEANPTQLIEKHLAFWKKLPNYYQSFYDHLKTKKTGYQGLIYREAVTNLENYSKSIANDSLVFAGFNALNTAEEKIFQYFLETKKAKVYWDIDSTFINDPMHDAGLFIRRIKNNWNYYKTNLFEWIDASFSQPKTIHICATSKAVGQAKIVSSIIDELAQKITLDTTALVLGDENLLLPMLYSLPNSVNSLNITMGYSAKNNPAQLAISKLFKMHINAISRSKTSYVFYYKDVLDVLTNPLIEASCNAKNCINIIQKNNITYISLEKILALQEHKTNLFLLIFQSWNQPSIVVLNYLSQLLLLIKSSLNYDNQDEKITNTFVYTLYKNINKLITFYSKNTPNDSLETLFSIYKQVVENAQVSFEGEPLNGLQVMGVLESRVLDFETVIITSVNEGKFPAGKSNNSFLPYDLKINVGLPTFKEKDAIYTYHFYHLLQRAKTVYLIYNSDSDGFDSGEKSRFISQLEVEKLPNHTLNFKTYAPIVPTASYVPQSIEKSQMVIDRLKIIATEGFSPSSITTYIRNPLQFYKQRILRISEVEEVEETIALNTLGTIIHKTLEELYQPFLNQFLTIDAIQNCFNLIEDKVLQQFKAIYKDGEIKKGKNLLAFEVAKRNIFNFLKQELQSLQSGDQVEILALEETFERQIIHKNLPFNVLIKGNVDRIERRNNCIRIIDYKTGKVEKTNVTLKSWDNLVGNIKNDKIIQVLAYAFMYEPLANGLPIEAGIISFKNLKQGFLPFTYKEGKETTTQINQTILANYTEEIVLLIQEIFDATVPFQEKLM